MIISTGIAKLNEVSTAINAVKSKGNKKLFYYSVRQTTQLKVKI